MSCDTLLRETGWQIEKIGERFVFSFVAAAHGGRIIAHDVTAEEFAMARAGRIGFEDLVRKYDR